MKPDLRNRAGVVLIHGVRFVSWENPLTPNPSPARGEGSKSAMIRVGAVNYLNTKPLIEGLEQFAPSIRLTLDLPSRLADQMERGELDVGLLPVAEVFRGGYAFLPNIAIASRGAVLSVTLFSKVPWSEIRSV